MKKQAGFTLIELVVVIIILGILAATALPKFMNVTDDAHRAAVAGVAGSFGSGVAMVHAQWTANGLSGAAKNIQGFGNNNVDVNKYGWPTGTRGNNKKIASAKACVDIWNGIMQNPPSVDTKKGADYRARKGGRDSCYYTYQGDKSVSRRFRYSARTGEVTVINNP